VSELFNDDQSWIIRASKGEFDTRVSRDLGYEYDGFNDWGSIVLSRLRKGGFLILKHSKSVLQQLLDIEEFAK
jgi:hypothetical protein